MRKNTQYNLYNKYNKYDREPENNISKLSDEIETYQRKISCLKFSIRLTHALIGFVNEYTCFLAYHLKNVDFREKPELYENSFDIVTIIHRTF